MCIVNFKYIVPDIGSEVALNIFKHFPDNLTAAMFLAATPNAAVKPGYFRKRCPRSRHPFLL